MNSEKYKKQSLKIIISEALMVLAVIITVAILALIVSGYWINSDFEVERQGMLQVASVPTGANINIDGEASPWLQRTNTSKVLPAGEHTVTLSKDGYDSWTKTINIEEGLLYRLNYPRLFLQNRTTETVMDATATTMAFVSANHNSMVLANNTTKWKYIKLDSDRPEPKTINISKLFPDSRSNDESSPNVFTDIISEATWDYDASHLLLKIEKDDDLDWVLLDVNYPEKSINLSKEFIGDFTKVKILDNSANNLLVIQDHNLRKIDVSNRSISAILAENVTDFDHYDNEIVFSAISERSNIDNDSENEYYIGILKIGDNNITKVITSSSPLQAVVSKFYDEKYLTIIEGAKATLYQKTDFKEYASYDLSFAPQSVVVGNDGGFIIMRADSQIATIDMEAKTLREWQIKGKTSGWLDNNMLYTVSEGELIVYDYDGFNERIIAKNVSSRFPVSITENKWLYYFSDNNLVRENLTE